MAKKKQAKFSVGDSVIFSGKKYIIGIVLDRPTGFYYALENRLGVVNQHELKPA